MAVSIDIKIDFNFLKKYTYMDTFILLAITDNIWNAFYIKYIICKTRYPIHIGKQHTFCTTLFYFNVCYIIKIDK